MSTTDDEEFAGHTPEPWTLGPYKTEVFAMGEGDHGPFKMADIRGWGYFTGGGGLRLSPDEAIRIQTANCELLAASPRLLRERNEARAELAAARARIAELEAIIETRVLDGNTPVEITVVYADEASSPVRIYPKKELPAFVKWVGGFYGKTDEQSRPGCFVYRLRDYDNSGYLIGFTY